MQQRVSWQKPPVEAIQNRNYLTWPLVCIKNVNKYLPESEETQFRHMAGQRQGVRSTKKVPSKKDEPQEGEADIEPLEENAIFSSTFTICRSLSTRNKQNDAKIPFTLTKRESFLISLAKDTRTKWYSITSTAMSSGWKPWKIDPSERWYWHKSERWQEWKPRASQSSTKFEITSVPHYTEK